MEKLKSRVKSLAILLALIVIGNAGAWAAITARGTVTDSAGEPLIGVSVSEKGATNGVTTDIDGNFTITVSDGAVIRFSYIGYDAVEAKAAPVMNITMKENSTMLDEVVAVGYGVQKKSVVTAAIAKVDASELESTAPVRMDNALKGLASGVTVTSSSGQPGAAARVRIRGVGTIHNSDPLYIVDGMPIEGGLDYLNPADIASIEVLKDAASGAVYGARAANGVVLVTTKQGKQGPTKVSYDFSYGWQSAAKRLKMLNAAEYAMMMNEGALNAGLAPIYADPASYGTGTDWQDEVFYDNAPVMNHQVSLSGASERINYMLSLGYYSQDGIVGGDYGKSNYRRLTMRSNLGITAFDDSKQRTWLNKFTIQANLAYTRVKSTGIDTNSTWGSVLGSALSMSPILTPTLEPGSADEAYQLQFLSSKSNYVPMYGRDGHLLMVPSVFGSFNEMTNPIANLMLPGAAKNWSHKFVGNFTGDLQIWDNLHYRISYGADLSFWGYDSWSPIYYLRDNYESTFSSATSTSERGLVWQIENTLNYDKTIGQHSFSILLGQSAKQSSGYYLGGSRQDLIGYDRPYIDAATGLAADGKMSTWGAPQVKAKLASYFARASYNFDERYMIQATVRRDGSSRFGSNNHWATFPSVSGGWNVMNEAFMEDYNPWLNNLKVRASWGKNGNENIGNFQYIALTAAGNNYIFGNPGSIINGTKPTQLANPDIRWEESTQTDVGIDFGFLQNRFTFSVDYFIKHTDGMLMTMSLPQYVGESIPYGNVGSMRNYGVEFDFGYRQNFGDFSVRVNANASWLRNKLISYGTEQGWANLDSWQGVGTITRAENGQPFPYFYGYKTDGILQNQAQADAYNAMYGTSLQPGDLRYVDVDNSGTINEDDRTNIGDANPNWTYGFNINLAWKGIDLSAFFQGVAGNDIYDATRRTDLKSINLPAWMLNRWTGEGTSNTIPRYVQGDGYNWQSSDVYIQDGSYFRLKNLQLGYTLPENLTRKVFVSKFRVYVAAENLFTATKYHGFDPEIAPTTADGTTQGVDFGVYPQARTWTVGFNLTF